MPHVILTEYEIRHDRLPALCIKCGRPATERFHRTIRFVDQPGRWWGLYTVAFIVGVFLLPPLLIPLIRRARSMDLFMPFCGPDLVRFRRRERTALVILVPIWFAIVAAVDGSFVVALIHEPRPTFLLAAGIAAWLLVVDLLVGWTTRRQKKTSKFRLTHVHPAFLAALAEDRARDRVDNPDRRDEFGDMRDDFDDEATMRP